MASRHCASSLRGTGLALRCRVLPESSIDSNRRICMRSLATAASPSISKPATTSSNLPPPPEPTARRSNGLIIPSSIPSHILPTQELLTTVYSFPALEPLHFDQYPHTHLGVPLRRDILHKAVIYEGDKSRQGTASTKWRSEIHGSGHKLRPQKGSGKARLGDRKSPMLRGGGVAHGPKPRSFATELPRKMYDRAWRMALSYRYRRGQLVVVDELGIPTEIAESDRQYWLKWALDGLGWGRGGEGHSFFITANKGGDFAQALEACDRYGRQRAFDEVDVKNLLEMKRLVVERSALKKMLRYHQSDLRLPLVRTPEQIAKRAEMAALQQVSELEMAKAVAAARAAQVNSETPSGLAGSTVAAAGAAAAVSGINDLSMDEVDRAAAEAEELLGEEEDFDVEEALESDELVDHEELEPVEERTR